jgi:predicted Zn-dependent protease
LLRFPDSILSQEKAKLLWNANSIARDYDKRITQVGVGFSDARKIIIVNFVFYHC